MKLVKQSKLFFKEGNSDKIYEIDLCEVGSGQFVVNFRFGKRGSILKEGTKTDKPISLNSAEQVYDALEAEKRKKGYQTESEMFQPLPEVPTVDLPNANFSDNAIMKRLQGFVTGTNPYKTEWKASRVIWRAGELKLQEAVPFIIRLTDRGDEMQRYCALWALARMGDASAERTMNVYFSNQKYTEKTRRMAGEGLVQVLKGDARQEHLNYYLNRLPEDLKNVLANAEVLGKVLHEKISLNLTGEFDFLEDLYILSIDNQILKKELVAIFREIPLKANFFKPVRHILKIAEVRDDFEVLGLLSYRFERTLEMFKIPIDYYGYEEDGREGSTYISAINQQLKVKAELKKKNSRIAYSDRTRAYLIRRTLRNLNELGQRNQQEYVKLAMSILLSYDSKTDYKAEYSVTEYSWQNGYRSYQKYFPAYADAVFMNLILYGGGDRLTFNGKSWFVTDKNNATISNRPQNTRSLNSTQDQQQGGILNRVFDSVFSMFSKKKSEENQTPQTVNQPIIPPPTLPKTNRKREELYPHLWDNIPQAYIQLLLKAKVDEIHGFAVQNLIEHPNYEKIKERIDFPLIHQFLASEYLITAGFGLELVKEKLTENPDKAITISLLNSPLLEARKFGLEIIEKDIDSYLGESAFVTNLVFSKYEDVRLWATMSLIKRNINEVQQQLLVGRSVSLLSTFHENNELNNAIIKDGTRILLKNCSDALQNVSNQVILDLLSSEVEAVQVFAVKIIILKNAQISAEMLCSLLASPFEQVRQAGSELLTEQKNRIATDKPFADALVNYLVPLLMKKEPYEGLHEDISKMLTTQLVEHLHAVDANTTIRLIHSNYVPAQDLGMVLLNKYIDTNSLTMRQIIDFSNHEQVNIRQWTWNYFTKNIARIKFEREESIRILDAKWDDSRDFAIHYFRDNFDVNDWTPEVLIGIADSVRPDIEAFGRELISRFFEDGQGEEYLLKLSQHPSLGVQLFATNYLERFAVNDAEKLKNLDYYFRSVLTRVNKGRSSKSRIFSFLHQEALKSEASATVVSDILRDVSATVSIEDKATCITIMRSLQERFEGLYLPLKVVEFETR